MKFSEIIIVIFLIIFLWFFPVFQLILVYREVGKIRSEPYSPVNYVESDYQEARENNVEDALRTFIQPFLPNGIILTAMLLFGMVPLIGQHCNVWSNSLLRSSDNAISSIFVASYWYLLIGRFNTLWFTQSNAFKNFENSDNEDEGPPAPVFGDFKDNFKVATMEITFALMVYWISIKFGRKWIFPILGFISVLGTFLLLQTRFDYPPKSAKLYRLSETRPFTIFHKFHDLMRNVTNEHHINFPMNEVYYDLGPLNAYYAGIFKPRIVISHQFFQCRTLEHPDKLVRCRGHDKTILNFPPSLTMAIVTHELGHWQNMHHLYMTLYTELTLVVNYIICGILHYTRILNKVFRIPEGRPAIEEVAILSFYVSQPFLTSFGEVGRIFLTRYFEYSADNFAKSMDFGGYLAQSLIRMTSSSGQIPEHDFCYDWFTLDHPCLMFRLERLLIEK